MIRFFLFVAIVWLVSKLVSLIFRSMTRPSQQGPKRSTFQQPPAPKPQMDFKDVKDAEFEDIPEKEKTSK